MRKPTADQILHFFALAKELGVECVVTNHDQRDYWVYEMSKKLNMVYDPNYYIGKDVVNGVEIRCRLTDDAADTRKSEG